MKIEKKKKGIWAAIRESMTKTGGCCGGGDCGCGPSSEDENKTGKKDSSDGKNGK